MLAGELVAHLDEDVEHRLLGGRQERVLEGAGHDLADGRPRSQRAHDDVVADRHEGEIGDEGGADAGRHEPLHGEVVVGVEGDARLEAGDLAGA